MTSDTAEVGAGTPTPIDPHRWYTIGAAARLVPFSTTALVAACDASELPCVRKPGAARGWRKVLGADLLEFMRRGGAKVPVSPKPAPPPAMKPHQMRRATRAKLDAVLAELDRL